MIAVGKILIENLDEIEIGVGHLKGVVAKVAAKIKESNGGNFVVLEEVSDAYVTAQLDAEIHAAGLLDRFKNSPLLMEIVKLLLGKLLSGGLV